MEFQQHLWKQVSSSKQSKQGKCEPTSSKCSLTIEKQNSFGPDSPSHNIVDEDPCHDSHVGVESMDLRLVLPSWSIEESKIGKRQRRQTKLLEELPLLNSIYGENFLLNFNSGIDISIPLRVLLSKEHLNDERAILKINWTDTQVGIHIEPRNGVKSLLTLYGKLQSAAKRKHIEGSIIAILNAVREAFNFGKIPIMVGHIIYPKYDRDYIQHEEIGSGFYGKVYRCEAKLEGTDCAIKKILLTKSEEVQRVFNEAKMLSLVRHPNVVGYYQAWIEDYRKPNNSKTRKSCSSSYGPRQKMMYIHMELCKGGSLASKLAKEKELRTDMAWSYSRQILEALQCIQRKNIIHRDLNPKNIFIDDSGTVKIGDFGLAMRKDEDVSSNKNLSPVGAALYRAPEMRKGVCITNKVDMFALGLILFELFCPRGRSEKVIQMLNGSESPCEICEEYKVDETAKPLILKLLRTDPLKRPSAADLLQDLDTLEVTRKNTQETEIQQRPEQEHIQIESQSSLMIKVHTHQDKRQKTVGIGITATDSMGHLQAGWALRERMSADPLQDKAVAVRLALRNAIDQGWRNIKVELDDRELVECIKETRNNKSTTN
ncbi:uncharacterized protein [Coffea arabica]|uniref:Uncharacterized protein isoform X2 n=1 Tax=Coffea arabica TaxID=13443 RepID=A0ABM4V4S7_COFAR